jgi:hypothetical protein
LLILVDHLKLYGRRKETLLNLLDTKFCLKMVEQGTKTLHPRYNVYETCEKVKQRIFTILVEQVDSRLDNNITKQLY